MGLGPSKAEYDATLQRLQTAERQARELGADKAALQQQVQEQAEVISTADARCATAIAAKDEELSRAVKQREVAEELRRSDALLAKRLLVAQLKHAGAQSIAPPDAARVAGGQAMGAAMALAAQDELELRKMLVHATNELDAAQQRAREAERAASAHRDGQITHELWLPELCDVSVMLRAPQMLLLGGVRMPRAARPGVRAAGLSL